MITSLRTLTPEENCGLVPGDNVLLSVEDSDDADVNRLLEAGFVYGPTQPVRIQLNPQVLEREYGETRFLKLIGLI